MNDINFFGRRLLGSSPNWKEEYTTVFGTEWSYEDALTSAICEGFVEAGPQAAFQLYVQMKTGWPTLKPLFGPKLLKAYYFSTNKPGEFI